MGRRKLSYIGGKDGLWLGTSLDKQRREYLSRGLKLQMDICINCNSHGMSKIASDTGKTHRKCSLCGYVQEVTEEMKKESRERVRP